MQKRSQTSPGDKVKVKNKTEDKLIASMNGSYELLKIKNNEAVTKLSQKLRKSWASIKRLRIVKKKVIPRNISLKNYFK